MMKFYAVIAVAAMLSLSVLVVVSPASYAFKAYNVNLNRTIDLPIELAYPKTTIQPGYPSCGTDTFETIHNVFDNEKKQDPKMFKSDMMGILTLSENSSYSWCGIEGPQPQAQAQEQPPQEQQDNKFSITFNIRQTPDTSDDEANYKTIKL